MDVIISNVVAYDVGRRGRGTHYPCPILRRCNNSVLRMRRVHSYARCWTSELSQSTVKIYDSICGTLNNCRERSLWSSVNIFIHEHQNATKFISEFGIVVVYLDVIWGWFGSGLDGWNLTVGPRKSRVESFDSK